MSFNVRRNDAHVKFFVARDGNGSTALWADSAHTMASCDTCAGDTRFMWGPAVVLMKRDPLFGGTIDAVWSAACRDLLNRDTAEPTH